MAAIAVIDASAIVEILRRSAVGIRAEEAARMHDGLIAPELIDAEVLQALKGHERAGHMHAERAAEAVADLEAAAVTRVSHRQLLTPAWQLRHNLSMYDALYVALAQELAAPLLTTDARIAAAPGLGIAVHVIT